MLACHLLSLLTPQLKSLPCFNTSSLRFTGMACGEQSELGHSNKLMGFTWGLIVKMAHYVDLANKE